MQQFSYGYGFKSLSKNDHDLMFEISTELAFHFERCVGCVQERYFFVYDPNETITWDEFSMSVEYVKTNLSKLCENSYYSHRFGWIANELTKQSSAITIISDPIAMIFDASYGDGEVKIIPVYEEIMLAGSRSYYVTKRGKLIPSSHGSHYRPIRYSINNMIRLSAMASEAQKALSTYNMSRDVDVLKSYGLEKVDALGKANFANKYPSAPIEAVYLPYYGGETGRLVSILSSKGRDYISADGERLAGNLFIKKDCIDYDAIFAEIKEVKKRGEDAWEKYNTIIEQIDVETVKINRAAFDRGEKWIRRVVEIAEYTNIQKEL